MPQLKKIVLAFDSFKGSATSLEIAEVAKQAISSLHPHCDIVSCVVADGGEGTTNAICSAIKSREVSCIVHDPLMRKITASYNITHNNIAIMEMAAASGLTLVAHNERDPEIASSLGTGEMIIDAIGRGCTTIILGIGGSATTDAGIGLLSSLGFRFRDVNGNETKLLCQVCSVDENQVPNVVRNTKFIVACDVNNPFYGINGAAHVYAPQKGASPEIVERLDNGLKHFAHIVEATKGINLQEIPGSGAAGGMGGGLVAFLDAHLQPGIDTILEMTDFNNKIKDASLIITGEGRIDNQSMMGKVIGGIVRHAQQYNIPVVAIGGSIAQDVDTSQMGLLAALPIHQGPISLEEAMSRNVTLKNISTTIKQIIRLTSL